MVSFLGSLSQWCCGEGGTLQTNLTVVCGECSQCLSCTGFAPLTACVRSWSTLLRLQVALQGAGPGLRALPRSKPLQVQVLGYSTKAQNLLGLRFVPFPGPSNSGDQVLGERTPARCMHLITSPAPATQFPGRAHLWCALCLFLGADLWL